MEYKVFDMHLHVFPENVAHKAVQNLANYYKVPMATNGTMEALEVAMDGVGIIKKCLIHSTATRPAQVKHINNFVASLTSDVFYGFGTVHPDFEDIKGEIDRMVKLGLRGIKLHPDFQDFKADSPKAFKIYEIAEGRLPVLIHAGDEKYDRSSPVRIRNIHDNFPNLQIIAAHLGGYKNWDLAEKYLVGTGIYLDTSSSLQVIEKEQAIRIIRNHGADKVFFGTDFPMHYHKKTLEEFFSLSLTEEENQKILWDNAIKFLGLE